jgi:Spy/CpxP family protein refolding chaperone
MKKKWLLLLILGLANVNVLVFAQQNQRNERRRAELEELKVRRVAFFTQAMRLSADEAKAFWPLFNELQDKKFELNQQLRRALSAFSGNERGRRNRTENEYKEMVNLVIQHRLKEAKLDEEYIAKFAGVISYEKIYRYQQAELQFARQMLDQRPPGRTPNNNR